MVVTIISSVMVATATAATTTHSITKSLFSNADQFYEKRENSHRILSSLHDQQPQQQQQQKRGYPSFLQAFDDNNSNRSNNRSSRRNLAAGDGQDQDVCDST